jgi:SAM-dependent methyltransferase
VIRLRRDDGTVVDLHVERWHGEASESEIALLRTITGPVLDVGCGPGRLVVALGRLGVPALGVDPSPGAIGACHQRGATALRRSVFDRLPGEGRWRTVLLSDGNIGIGGDAVRLLERCRALADPSGAIVLELGAPGVGYRRQRARLEHEDAAGPWFNWAEVGVDAVKSVAALAGLTLEALERIGSRARWFARLRRAEGGADAVA